MGKQGLYTYSGLQECIEIRGRGSKNGKAGPVAVAGMAVAGYGFGWADWLAGLGECWVGWLAGLGWLGWLAGLAGLAGLPGLGWLDRLMC